MGVSVSVSVSECVCMYASMCVCVCVCGVVVGWWWGGWWEGTTYTEHMLVHTRVAYIERAAIVGIVRRKALGTAAAVAPNRA